MNNSEALKNLKQSAKQQTEELKNFNREIHQENWNELSQDLTAITEKKLSSIESDISENVQKIMNKKLSEIEDIMNKKLSTIESDISENIQQITEQIEGLFSLKMMIFITITTAIIFLLFGLILAPTL